MRTFDDIQRRWALLFSTSIGVDLRQSVRDGEGFDPCEDGLRSVCWKAFLLYGPLSQGSWPKKLIESRSAYTSLRDHFLRFIDHPNDLHSSADPLADDDNSPWSTLRQDELNREEIFQDVTRCMQDNYFFREPDTQKKLLDILFIYAKLNPDIGYRQGMHELLAPILWIIQQDAVDLASFPNADTQTEGTNFMLEALNSKYVEHDTFSLFCAVMQTAKAFYEIGDNQDSSPIITRSRRIHDEILAVIDPELATHLTVVGILPQIYSIRWIRLLFGREFEFKQVLRIWDLLFAENLKPDIVDLTCVSMLLRTRWMLVEADYTTAITALTHYQMPDSADGPQQLVRDAIFLDRNRNEEAGATLIQRYTGRRPKISPAVNKSSLPNTRTNRTLPQRNPPSRSPGRFASPQRQLEGFFSEVTGNLQKRTEGWNVSKAVRSAVGEVRRNMNNYQTTTHLRQHSSDVPYLGRRSNDSRLEDARQVSGGVMREMEQRNKALARMLDDSLESLRSSRLVNPESSGEAEQDFNLTLAKIQLVSVYLMNPDLPILTEDHADTTDSPVKLSMDDATSSSNSHPATPSEANDVSATQKTLAPPAEIKVRPSETTYETATTRENKGSQPKPQGSLRPSLQDASFSFMLGEDRHRSSFVSSVAQLPEQRRDSQSKGRTKQMLTEESQPGRRESDGEDDGFTLTKIRGGRD
ncbi:hypothetical protein B0A52_06169 [Exophiala mesophila]|uniref:Rab-GAP TBC domain-containing protein n=1 Tax=Exophiala mesophila TaxID=212818 RepID=A0A438N2U1_EXOME|nr:hypothetical protein B0A52_06169 [Exophiala mesophila]